MAALVTFNVAGRPSQMADSAYLSRGTVARLVPSVLVGGGVGSFEDVIADGLRTALSKKQLSFLVRRFYLPPHSIDSSGSQLAQAFVLRLLVARVIDGLDSVDVF